MCVSETTIKVPFADEKNADLLRLSGKGLKAESEGRGARAKAAKQEIARRKANRATAKAAA